MVAAREDQGPLVRLNVNVDQETADAIRSIMEAGGVSATEAVRRAIVVTHYISEEQKRGRIFKIVTKGDRLKSVLPTV
jgi:hypothetical protein